MAPDKVTDHKQETQEIQDQPIDMESNEILNSEITMEELCKNIRRLKRRKAAAEDKITNELLIYTNQQLKEIILKVYNECLSHGVYPWNTALITPLHKQIHLALVSFFCSLSVNVIEHFKLLHTTRPGWISL